MLMILLYLESYLPHKDTLRAEFFFLIISQIKVFNSLLCTLAIAFLFSPDAKNIFFIFARSGTQFLIRDVTFLGGIIGILVTFW